MLMYDREGNPFDVTLQDGDTYNPAQNQIRDRYGNWFAPHAYWYQHQQIQAIRETPGYGIVVDAPDPDASTLPGQSVPSPYGEALPSDHNAMVAATALAVAQDVLEDVQRMVQSGAQTPEVRTAQSLIEDAVRDAQAANERNDAAGAVAAANFARQQARGVGVVNMSPIPAPIENIRQTVLGAVPGLVNAGYVPTLPGNAAVTMQQGTIEEGMTAGELHESLIDGYAPIRPDGSPYIVTEFQGGFLLDGAPLNCWIEGVWFAGQQELLTPYWQAGQIPQPPANIMLLPVVGMPEDVAANYAASQGGGLGILAILGLAASFLKR